MIFNEHFLCHIVPHRTKADKFIAYAVTYACKAVLLFGDGCKIFRHPQRVQRLLQEHLTRPHDRAGFIEGDRSLLPKRMFLASVDPKFVGLAVP